MRTQITRRIAKIASLTTLVSILFLTILAAGKLASSLPAGSLANRIVRHSPDTAPEAGHKNSAGEMHSALPQSQRGEKKKVINLAEVAEKERNLPPDDQDGDDPPDNTPLPFDGSFPSQAVQHNERLSAESSAYKLPIPSPTPISEFHALEDTGGFSPPDTHGAVGHDFLMVTLNNRVCVQSRTGDRLLIVRLKGFWSALEGIENVFDPRVIYDSDKRRWIFIAAANRRLPNSAILIGVSETSDPRGNWQCSLIDADPQNEANKVWADFPTIGFNKDWIVVQAKMLQTSGDAFVHSQILVFNKTKLYAGNYAGADDTVTRIDDREGFNWVPAITYGQNNPDAPPDPNLNKLYLVRAESGNNQGRGRLQIKWIGGAVGSETLSTETIIAQSRISWNQSPGDSDSAPQLGSPNKIATNDHRMQSVVYRNGLLWCAHSVFLGNPTRSSVQWWQIKPDGEVQQNGLIDDPNGRIYYAFPSLAVNRDNDVLIGYSRFSANQYASAYYSFRKSSDLLDTVREDIKLKEGKAPYYRPVSGTGRNRWGDYSSTVVDPTNDTDFWTIQEYAAEPRKGKDRWGTWWGRILPPDAVQCRIELEPTSPTPATPFGESISADGATVSVRVKPEGDCADWETESNNWWINVVSGHTGSGKGLVTFSVQPWNDFEPRTGSLNIAGKIYTITQNKSCIVWLEDTGSRRFPAQGGSGAVNFIDRDSKCSSIIPKLDPTIDWVKVETTANGFKYTVFPNRTTDPRKTTLLISGHTYTINQERGKPDDLALLTLPSEVGGIIDPPISYAIGNKVYWVFPNTHHRFPGVPLAVGLAGVAIAFEGDRNNPTRIVQNAPKLFLPFTQDEETTNNSDPDFLYRLNPFSAIDNGSGGVIIFYEKVRIQRKDTLFGVVSVGIGIARVSASNPMVAVREPELMFTGDTPRFGMRATVRGEFLYLYALQWGYIFTRELRVARVPLSAFADKLAYRAWDGIKWSQDISKAFPIGYFGRYDPSITWNAFLGKFVAVGSQFDSNRVLIQTALRPEGPWSAGEMLLTGPPPKAVGRFNGFATLHPIFFTGLGRTMMLSYQQPTAFFFSDTRLATVEFDHPERAEESFDKLKGKKKMVVLAFGQANSANHGEPGKSLMTAQQDVFCLYKGKLTKCVDPLPGASGNDGSVWTRLGGRIIDEGVYDAVVFIPIGEAGSEIARWAPGPAGDLHQRILDAMLMAKQHDLEITHLFWHQGETDASKGTSRDDYKARFDAMLMNLRKYEESLNKNGWVAPIYVSVASRCGSNPGDPEIQAAQCELVDPDRKIFPGPDTDKLDSSFRYDGCHFSNAGLEEFARLWIEQLKPGRRIAACLPTP